MPNGITQKELEEHYRRVQEANDRVVSVLKDVAVQFNTIANQLMLLAKSNEDIISTGKENHEHLAQFIEKGIDRLITCITENCDNCIAHVQDFQQKIDDIKAQIDTSVCSVKGDVVDLSKKIDSYDKERLKSSTIWIIIIGAITGAVGLATAIIKVFGK